MRFVFGQRLRDGTIGYSQVRPDDCLRAAVATALQVPPEDLPDPDIDRRLGSGEDPEAISRSMIRELEEWASERGLQIGSSRNVPLDRHRWIGVVPVGGRFGIAGDRFADHCLVMEGNKLLWNPALETSSITALATGPDNPANIRFGFWFETTRR